MQGFAMSLIRTILVLGAVVYVLPADTEKQKELIHTAGDTLAWAMTYCQREPATCDEAKVAWSQMADKAKFGAALVGDLAAKWSARQARVQPAALPVSTASTINDALAAPAEKGAVAEPLTPGQWDPSVNG